MCQWLTIISEHIFAGTMKINLFKSNSNKDNVWYVDNVKSNFTGSEKQGD